ncbi:M48 family metallopeptidase [Candidatus Fermentibacteria bacterium]|nr:M48 family metallopeptidase [Candidatus Fermentibacteria bacterium]
MPRILIALLTLMVACSTVPLTGRRQFTIVPESTMLSLSFQQYNEFLQENPRSSNHAQTGMIRTVGGKIQRAVELYFARNDMSSHLSGYRWEFNLVESAEVNAWCMPGGKVVVYSGILPLTQTESGLAVVMGHEVAHAVARHGNERMSQALAAQLGGMALSEALEKKPEQTKQLWLTVFGVGAQVGVLLPYSRVHETEADRLGLIFMAMAGYDPNEAVAFWQRMAAYKGGGGPPEFLSTHPSDASRIAAIRQAIPEAMTYFRQGGG